VTPKIPGIPRLNRHGGTRGISSTISLDSFNSTNNIKKGTISSKNRTNNITGSPITNPNINENIIETQREENSPQNAPIRSPITDPIINDNSVNIIDTQREENSPQKAPIRRKLRTRTTEKKQRHKMNTTVYRIFCGDGALHQGYICGFDTKEGYYKIKYQDGDIEEATEEEIHRMLKKPNKTSMARALSATRFDRIHEQYCKTVSRMPIASKFSNGFGKAVAILDYMGGKEDAFIPDKQEYKYRADAVINEETGKPMEYKDLLKDPKYREDWSRAAANEFGCLFNGVGKNADGTQRIVGTNTCHWIRRSQVPKGKKVTYARTVVAIRTENAEQKRVRITVGGDRLDYPGETSTDIASLDTTKILINSVLSTPGARMGAIDISNFYIHNDLKEYQYMRFHISMIPQEIIDEYNLQDIVTSRDRRGRQTKFNHSTKNT
jgi:hypothetical protein